MVVYTFMLVVTIVMMPIPHVMVTLIKGVVPLMICVENVEIEFLQSNVHVTRTRLTVEAAHNNNSVRITVINNIQFQSHYLAFVPNG